MKDGASIKELVGLDAKMFLFRVDDSIDHKKAKCMNKSVVIKTIHGKHKDVLLNNKCFKFSKNRIESKNHSNRNLCNQKNFFFLPW